MKTKLGQSKHVTVLRKCWASGSWFYQCTCGALQGIPVIGRRKWGDALDDSIAHARVHRSPEQSDDTIVVDLTGGAA